MNQGLVGDFDNPDVIVDVANVCRDEALDGDGHASWHRFTRVTEAWKCQYGIVGALRVAGFCDNSLRRSLSPSDQTRLHDAVENGLIRKVPDADPHILALAKSSWAPVLTRDGFVGWRREHPWLQGASGQFFGWQAHGQRVAIVPRVRALRGSASVSRAGEKDELKPLGASPDRHTDLLNADWACINRACEKEGLQLLDMPPNLHGSRPRCPLCRRDLHSVGTSSRSIELKFMVDGEVRYRHVLREGHEAVVGRSRNPALINVMDWMEEEESLQVSRQHVLLRNEGGRLHAKDLKSRNGTRELRWLKEEKRHRTGAKLMPDKMLAIDKGSALRLGPTLVVEQSGKRFPKARASGVDRTPPERT
jgi:hypothetical protein